MAAVVGAPNSLAEEPEVQAETGEPRYTFAMACSIAKGLKIKQLPKCAFSGKQENGVTGKMDLPLTSLDQSSGKMTHVVDVVQSYTDAFDPDEIAGFMAQQMYMNLPGKMKPAAVVVCPFKLQIVMLKEAAAENSCTIIKHYKFDDRQEYDVYGAVCQGVLMKINWGNQVRVGALAFNFMLDKLGGLLQYRWWSFDQNLADRVVSQSEIGVAIDCIRAHTPYNNADLKQTAWTLQELADPDSKINKSVTASKYTHLPIAWGDVELWAQKILEPLIPSLKRKSIIFLGLGGMGKTPLMHALMMALSRFHIKDQGARDTDVVPMFKTATDLDFYRDEPGERWCGCCLDDGDMSDLSVKVFKSFLDVSCREPLTRERWGASKFVQCQPRMMADNEFDASLDPTVALDGRQVRAGAVLGGAADRITNEAFIKMVRPAFPPCSEADLEAIFKRVNVIANTEHYVHARPRGLHTTSTIVTYKSEGSYIAQKAKDVLSVQVKREQEEDFFTMNSELADQTKRNPIDVDATDEPPSKRSRVGDGASSCAAILIENDVFLERSAALAASKECIEVPDLDSEEHAISVDDCEETPISMDDLYEAFMRDANAARADADEDEQAFAGEEEEDVFGFGGSMD
ncbi:unnamed protein product [Prorocentrum cordatum]|uniref:Uncharacterized protein n=1 Tax=Prorocentrum cordatum TaxID=2364126 RepID=A0ABN9PD71_9DINO|nr:unnamed protein product [Polarella glacialis]